MTSLRIGRDQFFSLELISNRVVTKKSVVTDHRIGRDRYFGLEPNFRSRPILDEHTITTAKAFAKSVFINQERKLEVRRRSDTALVLTINDAS